MSIFNLRSFLIGILATFTMDVLSTTALKQGFIAFLSPRLTGRWFALMARGQFVHTDLGQTAPGNHEMAVAVRVHYAVGLTLALSYLVLISVLGLSPRNLTAALGFALCTTLLPWLLMFSAMGYGWFGTHGPTGTRLFVSSLLTHCFYGIGLCLGSHFLVDHTSRVHMKGKSQATVRATIKVKDRDQEKTKRFERQSNDDTRIGNHRIQLSLPRGLAVVRAD